LNLSEIVIHRFQKSSFIGIASECREAYQPLQCSYNKKTDKIYICKFAYWLQNHWRWKRPGCGQWYSPVYSNDIFSTSQTVMYSRRLGRDVTLPNCALRTLEWPKKTIHTLDEKMMESDADFRDTFYSITHIKVVKSDS